jgi:ganglioside GM2 activator
VILGFVLLALAIAAPVYDKEATMKLLSIPQGLSRDQHPPQHPYTFSFNNCGAKTGGYLVDAKETPDPIVLGGNISVYAVLLVAQQYTSSNFQIALSISKKVLGVWIPVPCIDNIGSCLYKGDFLCNLLATQAMRPEVKQIMDMYSLPEKCPIEAKTYSIPKTSPANIHLDDPHLEWLVSGDLYVKLDIQNAATATQIACVEIYITIK